MKERLESYQSIKEWHDENLFLYRENNEKLQWFHEIIFASVFDLALKEMMKEHGGPPCDFSWFVTGSAGRREQAAVSDQDHGIIFKEGGKLQNGYFLAFGEKLVQALEFVGYPLCEGNVMSSKLIWCRPECEWQQQIFGWIRENTWKSLRYLLIFMDARTVAGDKERVLGLKRFVFQIIQKEPSILERLFDNTKHNKKAIGALNQLLPIPSGPYTGCIHLKTAAFIPYVNAVRLLSIIESIEETSTLGRIKALSLLEPYKEFMHIHYENFSKLLQYRLFNTIAQNYEDGQYLNIKKLNKAEKEKLKRIFKDIKKLQKFTLMRVQGAVNNER